MKKILLMMIFMMGLLSLTGCTKYIKTPCPNMQVLADVPRVKIKANKAGYSLIALLRKQIAFYKSQAEGANRLNLKKGER